MKTKNITLLVMAVLMSGVLAAPSFAAVAWTENWESYTSGSTPYGDWVLGNGSWMPLTGTGNAFDSQAYHITAGGTSRVGRNLGFAPTNMQTITLEGYFYDNNGASSSKRSFLGFQNEFTVDNALVRIGGNNAAQYQVHYWNGALQTVNTGLGNETGWHYVKLSLENLGSGQWKLDWQINAVDNTPFTGSVTWAWSAATATKVLLGYNFSSTVAIDWDNITLSYVPIPEPSAAGLGLLGGLALLWALRRRAV